MLLLVTKVQTVCSLLPKMLPKLQAKETQCMEEKKQQLGIIQNLVHICENSSISKIAATGKCACS